MTCLGDFFSECQGRNPKKFLVAFYPWVGRDPQLVAIVEDVEEALRRMRDITTRDRGVPFLIFPLDVLRRTGNGVKRNEPANRNEVHPETNESC
jgi:hypothetical protein